MSRRLWLVLAAVVLGVVGVFLVVAGSGGSGAARAASEEQVVPVLVAAQLIPAGTSGQQLAEAGMVELRDVPAVAVPPGSVADVVPLREMVATAEIQPGEMLMQAKFVSRSLAGSVKVPDDRLAMSVEVDAAQRVGEFIQPGTEVAVFTTYPVELPEGEPLPPGVAEPPAGSAAPTVEMATRLMIPRVPVLAVAETTVQGMAEQTAQQGEGEAQPAEPESMLITLAVSVEEGQKLAHSIQAGNKLTLGLLSERSRTGTAAADDNRTLFN